MAGILATFVCVGIPFAIVLIVSWIYRSEDDE